VQLLEEFMHVVLSSAFLDLLWSFFLSYLWRNCERWLLFWFLCWLHLVWEFHYSIVCLGSFTKILFQMLRSFLLMYQTYYVSYKLEVFNFLLSLPFCGSHVLHFTHSILFAEKKGEEALRNYFKFFFVICYIFPAIGVLVCILRNALGQTEDYVWCWITSEHQNMRFAVYYIPLVIMWVFNAFIYILLSREKYSSLSYGFLIQEGKRRLRLYILVFVIAKTPALVNRLCNLFLSDRQLFVLFLLQAIFDSLFGFFESLVYITLVKKRLPNCCCHPKEEGIGLADPLIHRETVVPYSSIAERMYYSSSKKQRSINSWETTWKTKDRSIWSVL